MVSRKYRDDYKIENITKLDGRVVKHARYIGPYFALRADAPAVGRTRLICTASVVLLWLLYIVSFVQDGFIPRQLYVAALYMCTVFPLVYVTWSVITLAVSRAPFDRETNDDLYKKFGPASSILLILSGVACIAVAVNIVLGWGQLNLADAVFAAGNFLSCGLAWVLFSRRKVFDTAELERGSELLTRMLAEKEAAKNKKKK